MSLTNVKKSAMADEPESVMEVPEEYVFSKKNVKSGPQLVMQIMFSHFGLFLLVAIYAIAGAYAFISIEENHELFMYEKKMTKAKDIEDAKNYVADEFWFMQDEELDKTNFTAKVQKHMKSLEQFIIESVEDVKYDGTIEGWEYAWTFSKSLLFTMTTITTIGYGHIFPVTMWGQVFCIMYAIVGCPLTFIFLANIGDSMAKSFVYIYSRCCCRPCRSERYLSELPEGVSKKKRKMLIYDEVGQEEYMPTDEVDVPITLNLVLLFAYIWFGAILFKQFENWDLTSSLYFTFVTLSTIGFGDMVPNKSLLDVTEDFAAFLRMVVTVCYIILGMALLSMCINLMQEQVLNKCKWVAEEVGLSKKDEKNKVKDIEKKGSDKPQDSGPIAGTPPAFKYESPPGSPAKDLVSSRMGSAASAGGGLGVTPSGISRSPSPLPGAIDD